MKYLALLFSIFYFSVSAQIIKPDTSFTVYGAYLKEKKKRPYISIASPIKSDKFKTKKNIVFANYNTGNLALDVVYPSKNNAKLLPAVLFIFGGGWRSGDRSQNIPLAQKLAENGYVSITADYRLSTHALFPAAVYDLKNAVRWIKANAAKYNIDSNKITVVGFSAGGQLAALIGTTNNDQQFEKEKINSHTSTVHAVIDVDGVLAFDHPESSEVSTDPNRISAAAMWLGANLKENPDLWHNASALNHADKNTVPMLFINSSLPRFHASRDDLIAKIKPFNIYTEVHEIANTPHPFWLFNPWFDQVHKLMVTFLDKEFK
ncbi:alpha/beta hydrolase [Pedobacter mucosus]|uniref:alpha/beta hydrolase n=1 Tax=Pedobacter mucosus TaxID=2895286 RepID=UPI001EE3A93A|nr:alpha/beta hydrolase [Pedobacter mucosus]UKT65466.1 alpha/beta hydrolase [Pedobacter mucosus]